MQHQPPGIDRVIMTDCPHGELPADCPFCRPHLVRLGQALHQGHENEISCAQFLSVVATRGGDLLRLDNAVGGDALLSGHVARCVGCAADLAAARGALASLAEPQALFPPSIPEFDLDFLRSATPVPLAAGRWRVASLLAVGMLAIFLAWCTTGRRPDSLVRTDAASNAGSTAIAGPVAAGPQAAALPTAEASAPAADGSGSDGVDQRATGVPVLSPSAAAPKALAGEAAPRVRTPVLSPVSPVPAAASPGPGADPDEPDEPDEPARSTVGPPTPLPDTVSCGLHAFGPQAGLFATGCGPFRSAAAFDLYQVTVSRPGRWTFDTCEGTLGLDTVLVLYPAGGFDPTAPCQGILAAADDGCGTLSRLTVDLAAGRYLLLVSEQTGDLSDHYRLGVEAPTGNDACPRVIAVATAVPAPSASPPVMPSPATPSPTAAAGAPQPPLATPVDVATPVPPAPPLPGTPGAGAPSLPTDPAALDPIATATAGP